MDAIDETIIIEHEDVSDEEAPEKGELQPLFLLLASSLNVELVYVILKSITQFAYVNSQEGLSLDLKKKAIELNYDEGTGDASLQLTQIKIKHSH